MAFIKWFGRVILWVVFLPLGLWRSIKHGKDRRQAELIKAIQQDRQTPLTIRGIPSDDLPPAP